MICPADTPVAFGQNEISNIKCGVTGKLYGNRYPFSGLFLQTDKFGNKTSCISRLDNNFTVTSNNSADFSEISAFLHVYNAASVFCTVNLANQLGLIHRECFFSYMIKPINNTAASNPEIRLEELYKILYSSNGENMNLPDFEYWYPDFCLRYNHGFADYCAEGPSAAAAGFIYGNSALITGVSVKKEFRGNGLGKKILSELLGKLSKLGSVYALSSKQTSGFYEKCGFIKQQEYCIAEIM